jgi:hypothetical protein
MPLQSVIHFFKILASVQSDIYKESSYIQGKEWVFLAYLIQYILIVLLGQ